MCDGKMEREDAGEAGDGSVSHVTWPVLWLWRSATTMAGEEVSTGWPGGSCLLGSWGLLRLQPGCWAARAGVVPGEAAGASGCPSVKVTDRFCSAEGTKRSIKIKY